MTKSPDGWKKESGYNLNSDGQVIKYKKENENVQVLTEASADEDVGKLEYITFYENGDNTKIVNKTYNKEEALDFMHQVMEDGIENVNTSW